ncbi:MAG: hypothetical protein Q9170_003171 [Blastenia crenularia]
MALARLHITSKEPSKGRVNGTREDINLPFGSSGFKHPQSENFNHSGFEGGLLIDEATDEKNLGGDISSDKSSGYDRGPPPVPCTCGYINDGNEHHSSEERYSNRLYGNSYTSRWYSLRDGNLSSSYRHHVTCKAKASFPFKDLPPEIQSMILRFLMPDDRNEPLHSQESDPDDGIDLFNINEPVVAKPIPALIDTGLFQVDRAISAEALRIFHHQTFVRMDVTPFGIRAREGLTGKLGSFANHKVLAGWKFFNCMRNYHLNIKSSSVRRTYGLGDLSSYLDPRDYKDGADRIREWLRLICDELVTNNIIQNLTITAPCRCAQEVAKRIPKDDSLVADLFTPLKRIRLPNTVLISFHHDEEKKKGASNPCLQPQCLALAHVVRASIGQPQGQPLDEREAIWKDIKSLKYDNDNLARNGNRSCGYDGTDRHQLDFSIQIIWKCLNRRGPASNMTNEENCFQHAAQNFYDERAKAVFRRLERKRKYEERQKAKRQAEQKSCF